MSDKSAGAPYCLPTSPERETTGTIVSRQPAGRRWISRPGCRGGVTGFPRKWEESIWGAYDQDGTCMELSNNRLKIFYLKKDLGGGLEKAQTL